MDGLAELLIAIRDLPVKFWLSISLTAIILLLPPANKHIGASLNSCLISIAVLSSISAIFSSIVIFWKYIKKNKMHKAFRLTPIPQQCWWSFTGDRDYPDKQIISLLADFYVKNCTKNPIFLVNVSLKKIPIIQQVIIVYSNNCERKDNVILASETVQVRLSILIDHKMAQKKVKKSFHLSCIIYDSDGNKDVIRLVFKPIR